MIKDSCIDPFVLSLSTWLKTNGFLTTSCIFFPFNSMSLGYMDIHISNIYGGEI
jgi:hypothetical protein